MDELIDGLGLGGLQNLCEAYFGNYYYFVFWLLFRVLFVCLRKLRLESKYLSANMFATYMTVHLSYFKQNFNILAKSHLRDTNCAFF